MKFKKILKQLFVEPMKTALSVRAATKKVSVFVRFYPVIDLLMEWYPSRGFLRYTCKRFMAFPKQISGSLDHLTLTPSSDKVSVGDSSLQVWLWLPFRVFSVKYFCPNHQRLPEKFQKFLQLGGLQPPSSPRLVRLCQWLKGPGQSTLM